MDNEFQVNAVQTEQFGEKLFSKDEREEIGKNLQQKLEKDQIAYRPGPNGSKVAYLESWRAIELANEIFGFNGWSSSVISLSQDFLEEMNGKISCGITAVVRVTLKDGTYHEDVGYGVSEGIRGKGAALEKAKKEAVSDALKRALRLFGNSLGNSVYDKEHLKQVRNGPPPMASNVNGSLPSSPLPPPSPISNSNLPAAALSVQPQQQFSQQQFSPASNQQFNPLSNQQFNPASNQQFNPPSNQQFNPASNQQFNPPFNRIPPNNQQFYPQ